MGLFRRRVDPVELERMRDEIAALRQTLEQQGSWTLALEGRLNALATAPMAPNEPGCAEHDCVVAGELRHGQVRLASEQVRYQIAFRQDLARLADQLKRSPSSTR